MAFPTLNSVSLWLTATGALLVNMSLVVGEFARTGWLPYPPLSELGIMGPARARPGARAGPADVPAGACSEHGRLLRQRRAEAQRTATERNLHEAGYAGYDGLFMVPDGSHYAHAVDFKAPVRARIEGAGHTIVATMGDQPSDLAGGHAERTFLLTNPSYRIL